MRSWVNVISNYWRKGGDDNFSVTKKSTVICEYHFKESEVRISIGSGRKTLVTGAIPSIFSWKCVQTTKRKSPRKRRFPENTQSETEFVPEVPEVDMEVEECCNECILHLWRWKSVVMNAFFIYGGGRVL